MSTIGSYTLIKNEKLWIAAHLFAWLPYLDQMVFMDGNSTDDTQHIIREIQERYPLGHKITCWHNVDPKDLQDDYVRVQNQALNQLNTDYAIFLHPDMFPLSGGEKLKELGKHHAYFHRIKSYAGEPGDRIMYQIMEGRGGAWKNIMRKKNPDLGLHYHGHYGAVNEDMYFSAITGTQHDFHGTRFEKYPFEVGDSGLEIAHFSDVRPLKRRIGRMVSCLINQGWPVAEAKKFAPSHPRVNFDSRDGFVFSQCNVPKILTESQKAYEKFLEGIKANREKFLEEAANGKI